MTHTFKTEDGNFVHYIVSRRTVEDIPVDNLVNTIGETKEGKLWLRAQQWILGINDEDIQLRVWKHIHKDWEFIESK